MTRALVDNASDPQQVEQGKRTERMAQKDQDARWGRLLDSYDGRAVLWEVMGWSQPYRTTFVADPYRTAFNEGERNMSLRVLQRVSTLAPKAYQMMQQEATDRAELLTRPKTKRTEPVETEDTDGD